MRCVLLATMLLSIPFLGCLGGDDETTPPPPATNRTLVDDPNAPVLPGETDNETSGSSKPMLSPRYLSRDRRLVSEPPSELARVGLPPVTQGFLTGFDDLGFFTLDKGPDTALVISRATANFQFVRDAPGTADPRFPVFGTLFGVAGGTMSIDFVEAPATLMAEAVTPVIIEMSLPKGGLVVPPGRQIVFGPFGAYHPDFEASSHNFVQAGGDDPSRIEAMVHVIPHPAFTEQPILAEGGELQGDACNTEVGEPRWSASFEVPPGVSGLRATLTRTGGQGTAEDIDFDLVGPTGEVVAGGHTPFGNEVIELYGPNIEAIGHGGWQVHVNSCAAQSATFTLDIVGLVAVS